MNADRKPVAEQADRLNSEACSFTVRACQSSPIGFLSQSVRGAYGRRRRSIVPVLQRASALPLAKEPIGIAARLWTADLLKSFRRILVQRQFGRPEIAAQMLDRAGADDWGNNARPVCDPAQGDLRRRHASLFRDANDAIDGIPVAIGVRILFGN